jgi:ribosomal protein S15P/S13E
MAATTARLRPCLAGQLSIFLHTRASHMRQIIARHPEDGDAQQELELVLAQIRNLPSLGI